MTALQVEANKVREQMRTNKANEDIRSMEALTKKKTYEMQKQEQPFRVASAVTNSISDVLSPVTSLAGSGSKILGSKIGAEASKEVARIAAAARKGRR